MLASVINYWSRLTIRISNRFFFNSPALSALIAPSLYKSQSQTPLYVPKQLPYIPSCRLPSQAIHISLDTISQYNMPLIFTTPTGEVFELTPETLPSHILHSIMLTDTYNPADFKPLAPEMNLPIRPLPKSGGPGPLDGTTEGATATPSPSSTPTEQSPHRQSCGSASPLIEILNPDELAHKNAPNPRRAATTPVTSPIRPGRRDGTRPRSLVKVAMAYNEYGELMEEIKLQHHPTPDELSITQLLRVIRKKFHHTVST